ncbi:IclR family transcriptional regulator [Nocardia africana]|uniref:Glycerol operon regulatory protein n=1 Tax=Nocardia africana TaxID=134964 RepID=A0A378WUK3_9NOCA|nr:IclR family transcriptional regulator [Nocardia africana]MCC3313789.1 IclR family transcriptional regulator [Nocardia africana]SUA44829.1 Transcriptional regulator kdgR [Nocardia africana]
MAPSNADHEDKRRTVEGGLKSVVAALDLLDCFREAESLGVTDVARQLGIGKSSAHRLLTSLCDRGYAVQDPRTGRYQLGLHVYELGQLAIGRSQIRQRAMPILEDLRRRTGFTIHLAVPERANIIYVERLHAPGRFRQMANVNYCLPAHLTSSGKAIAAFNPRVAQARRLAGFPPMTTASIHDVALFDAVLDDVRRRGFAVNDEEVMTGMTAVAAPVCDRSGVAHAAISLVATADELRDRVDSPGRLVVAAATKLARAVNF